MPKKVNHFRLKIGEAVEYVSNIINDAEQFAVKIGVPRREMLFIFLDQCLGRCECASPKDRAALKKFFAQREKASQGDFSARMEALWKPITDDEDQLLDGPSKRPYWTKKTELAYDCPTREVTVIFKRGKLARVHHSRSPLFEEARRLYYAKNTTG